MSVSNRKIVFVKLYTRNVEGYDTSGDNPMLTFPKLYKSTDINPINKKTYGELYDDTIKREEIIKKEGYNLIVIWESEYYKITNNIN